MRRKTNGDSIASNSTKTLGAASVLALLASVGGCDDPGSVSTVSSTEWRSRAAENLAADASCTACHEAGTAVRRRLGGSPAPLILGANCDGGRPSPPAPRTRVCGTGAESGLRQPGLPLGVAGAEEPGAGEER
ncbi:MAG: hypothetical protein GY704_17420, partial [Phycisphaeraceae bacterium]|nr:hypothetical protein [Phycisphaeraceae bacterium]